MSATFSKFCKSNFRKIRNYRPDNGFPCANVILTLISQAYPLEEAAKLTLDSIVTEFFYQDVSLQNFIIYHMRRGYNLNLKPEDVKEVWYTCYNVIQYYYHKSIDRQSRKAGHYKINLWRIQYKTKLIPAAVKHAYKPKRDYEE